jgi:hypothetical protein
MNTVIPILMSTLMNTLTCMLTEGGKKIMIMNTREIMVPISMIIQDTKESPTTIPMNESICAVE